MKSNQFHKYNRIFWPWIVVYCIIISSEIFLLNTKSFEEGKFNAFGKFASFTGWKYFMFYHFQRRYSIKSC